MSVDMLSPDPAFPSPSFQVESCSLVAFDKHRYCSAEIPCLEHLHTFAVDEKILHKDPSLEFVPSRALDCDTS